MYKQINKPDIGLSRCFKMDARVFILGSNDEKKISETQINIDITFNLGFRCSLGILTFKKQVK